MSWCENFNDKFECAKAFSFAYFKKKKVLDGVLRIVDSVKQNRLKLFEVMYYTCLTREFHSDKYFMRHFSVTD